MKRAPIRRALWALAALLAGHSGHLPLAVAAPEPAESHPRSMHLTHVDPAAAGARVKEKSAVILDIRTPAEYKAGHSAGALNLDFRAAGFSQRLAELDRNTVYVVHCASGGRSTRSLPTFEKLGFKDVAHLAGGFNAWQKAGRPVVK